MWECIRTYEKLGNRGKSTENYKNSLVEQGYVWIVNPFEDWDEDIKPYLNEKRLGYYVR